MALAKPQGTTVTTRRKIFFQKQSLNQNHDKLTGKMILWRLVRSGNDNHCESSCNADTDWEPNSVNDKFNFSIPHSNTMYPRPNLIEFLTQNSGCHVLTTAGATPQVGYRLHTRCCNWKLRARIKLQCSLLLSSTVNVLWCHCLRSTTPWSAMSMQLLQRMLSSVVLDKSLWRLLWKRCFDIRRTEVTTSFLL